jgi:hypothetical protein
VKALLELESRANTSQLLDLSHCLFALSICRSAGLHSHWPLAE